METVVPLTVVSDESGKFSKPHSRPVEGCSGARSCWRNSVKLIRIKRLVALFADTSIRAFLYTQYHNVKDKLTGRHKCHIKTALGMPARADARRDAVSYMYINAATIGLPGREKPDLESIMFVLGDYAWNSVWGFGLGPGQSWNLKPGQKIWPATQSELIQSMAFC